MNRIAIYLRLSEEDYKKTDESVSISNQRDYTRSYIENDNSLKDSEIEEYIDDGYSATNTNRPAFLRLVDDIKGGKVETIVVKDMSRFSRDYILLGDYLSNILPFLKIRFIAINDNYDSLKEQGNGLDTDTQFKTLYYDLFSKELSEKVRSSVKQIKSQGKNTNWAAPFGYIKDPKDKYHIIIDEKTAFIVKEAFDLLLKGYSCTQVANIFNKKGYITRSERKEELKLSDYSRNFITGSKVKKRAWTSICISQITRNELYTGDYVYNKYKETRIGGRKRILLPEEEWRIIPNTHEAIISREVFDKVKRIKEKRNFGEYTGNKNRSIFSDKIFCKECGRHMSFRSDSRQKKNSDKDYKYKSYFCYFCKAEKTPNNIKERDIIELIKPKLKNFKIQNTLKEERVIEYKNVEEEILKEIAILNANLQTIYENYKRKNISKEEYLKEKTLIQDKKVLLENKLEEVKSKKIDSKKEFASNSLDENNLLKAYVDSSIDKIIVSRTGEIEIIEV
ncbi:TPA: recombinase family protein [Streptococcus pyogenes]|jgi:site-specific recombinase|uniref:recombinase family protein n=1 Tax=Streptococcus intermedius TaxID=1338 RepID=UPI000F66A4ED|nr:recombinase family protein [Streptococcus intermedius]VRN00069.1 conjugative transposon site-specific recombinase [Streptococcus pneumoniae]HES2285032.1 recombinase family protein [Streptococcus pyogenes]RSJ27936.1 Recombinase [Streptococcus intermedius]HEX0142080.1 recombinase family protein [Streptococcus pneumoniae]HEX0143433.1 recombinase family protein [Streptococcus pneumoniae]